MTDPTYPERIFATATRAKGSTGQIGTWREADDGTGRAEYVRADSVPAIWEALKAIAAERETARDSEFLRLFAALFGPKP